MDTPDVETDLADAAGEFGSRDGLPVFDRDVFLMRRPHGPALVPRGVNLIVACVAAAFPYYPAQIVHFAVIAPVFPALEAPGVLEVPHQRLKLSAIRALDLSVENDVPRRGLSAGRSETGPIVPFAGRDSTDSRRRRITRRPTQRRRRRRVTVRPVLPGFDRAA